MEHQHFSWENSLFLWPFSIAFLRNIKRMTHCMATCARMTAQIKKCNMTCKACWTTAYRSPFGKKHGSFAFLYVYQRVMRLQTHFSTVRSNTWGLPGRVGERARLDRIPFVILWMVFLALGLPIMDTSCFMNVILCVDTYGGKNYPNAIRD